jgi:AAA15 family ATPase/GTPase
MTEFVSNKITIKNFVVIKEAEIDIKDINVIIGQQSSGKSLIAKLIYFFSTLEDLFINYVYAGSEEHDFEGAILEKFSTFFPPYLWRDKSFRIEYSVNDFVIVWRYTRKTANSDFKHKIILSRYVREVLASIKDDAINSSTYREIRINDKVMNVRKKYPKGSIYNDLKEAFPYYFCKSLFIPSGRTFLHTLKLNTFFLENLQVDPFVKEFGREYSTIKQFFIKGSNTILEDHDEKAFFSILNGRYAYDDGEDEDWIVSGRGHTTKLVHASSGQQESLPMLAALAVSPILMFDESFSGMLFIEEPEAHLFPTAQNEVISFISSVHESYRTRFFMTSHSPYVISALNNMIQANEAVRQKLLSEEQFSAVNKGGASIPFERVSAYTIEDGIVRSIMDEEFRMIGAYKLDDISSHFQSVMDYLLELES